MTAEQRKAYNQRRYMPRNRKSGESSNKNSDIKQEDDSFTEEGLDALTSIEQEINRQTRQAQEVLKQQRVTPTPSSTSAPSSSSTQWRNPTSQPAQIIVQQTPTATTASSSHDPTKYQW